MSQFLEKFDIQKLEKIKEDISESLLYKLLELHRKTKRKSKRAKLQREIVEAEKKYLLKKRKEEKKELNELLDFLKDPKTGVKQLYLLLFLLKEVKKDELEKV